LAEIGQLAARRSAKSDDSCARSASVRRTVSSGNPTCDTASRSDRAGQFAGDSANPLSAARGIAIAASIGACVLLLGLVLFGAAALAAIPLSLIAVLGLVAGAARSARVDSTTPPEGEAR
jgi:hypothetical protein